MRQAGPPLMLTNSAMLCKPGNWFLAHLLEKLGNQSPQCRGAIVCTGPVFMSMHYTDFQRTNMSKRLPQIDDFRYFEDMVDRIRYKDLNDLCVEPLTNLRHEWSRDICREWIARGREKRNISEKAYTYHTWFHTYMNPQMLRVMDTKSWVSLKKKVDKLNTKFKGANIVVLGVVGRQLMSAGVAEINLLEEYRNGVFGNLKESTGVEAGNSSDLEAMMMKHVFDMNLDILRCLVAAAAGPPNSLTNKSGRRNWYREDSNCPEWWKKTTVPFQSVNKPGQDGKRLTMVQLMELTESLQQHTGVIPLPPVCSNRTSYKSRFVECPMEEGSAEQELEEESIPEESGENLMNEDQPMEDVEEKQSSCQEMSHYTIGMNGKKRLIQGFIENETISLNERALCIMREIECWDVIWGIADLILNGFMKYVPNEPARRWTGKRLTEIDKRYEKFDLIPLTVGERTVLQSTPNGNCIYNAISIALCGNEDLSMVLKLLSVAAVSERLIEFSKYLKEEYGELAGVWCEPSKESTPANIETHLRTLFLDVLAHPYKDGTILNLIMLSHLLGRPIQQHCSSLRHVENLQLIIPPLDDIRHPAALHLVWVPTTPRNRLSTINHVVPAVCCPGLYGCDADECAFTGLGMCALLHGYNNHVSKPHWVCCGVCDQWVHTICMNIPPGLYSGAKQFACGCDSLTQSGLPKIKDIKFYKTMTISSLPTSINLETIMTTIPDSLRRGIFSKPGNNRLKENLRMRKGPFTEDFIHSLTLKMRELMEDEEMTLLPDIYIPEVLLCVIMCQEEVTRLVAEKILLEIH